MQCHLRISVLQARVRDQDYNRKFSYFRYLGTKTREASKKMSEASLVADPEVLIQSGELNALGGRNLVNMKEELEMMGWLSE